MKILDLFSGIGGISLGLERAGMKTVAFCEIEPFQRTVLKKHWPEVPIYDDIRALSADVLRRAGIDDVDIIAGGFPCQDVSVAGKGAGVEHGERSGLWREMFRLVRELMPRWVLAENVPALRTRGGDLVIADLETAGYAVWPLVVGAWAVGAPHKRDRVWIVATRMEHAQALRRQTQRNDDRRQSAEPSSELAHRDEGRPEIERRQERRDERADALWDQPDGCREPVADAEQMRWEPRTGEPGDEESTRQRRDELARSGSYGVGLADSCSAGSEERHITAEPDEQRFDSRCRHAWPARPGELQHEWEESRLMWPVGASVDGVPEQLVRFANRCTLGAAGNSVVPQVVEVIGRAIMVMEVAA